MSMAADDAALPDDPEFRAAFMGYVEWGTRLALHTLSPTRQSSSTPRCRAGDGAWHRPTSLPNTLEDRSSAVEHRPADVVAQPLVVEHELADRVRKLRALPGVAQGRIRERVDDRRTVGYDWAVGSATSSASSAGVT
jgi:hypothetical protein